MLRRMELAARLGARAIMVDLLTVGWSAAQTLTRAAAEAGLAVHAHRAFHAAFTRDPRHGMAMLVVAKLARLAGVDLLHIGTGVGKMHGAPDEVRSLAEALREHDGWAGLRAVFPVASGGLHPLHIPALVANLGRDVLIQAGGGVHGHPGGTRAGARAMRQAIDAALQGATLADYAPEHRELAQALEVWG
jgi:ribulose-bisphosphate carboxylase large chain